MMFLVIILLFFNSAIKLHNFDVIQLQDKHCHDRKVYNNNNHVSYIYK